VKCFRPADEIDPAYGTLLRRALSDGIEVLAYKATVSPNEITLTTPVPIYI
jgi:sugar fermentation stimulation protein A